jgi:hypothetical protein
MKALFINGVIKSYGASYDALGAADGVYDVPDDYDFERYTYAPNADLSYNPSGFALATAVTGIDFVKRQENVNAMNQYMADLVTAASISQANFDTFLTDTSPLIPQYLGGGSKLITWIETVSRNGYDARTIGFKTKSAYRGVLLSGTAGTGGQYQRAIDILAILNNL